VSAGPALTGGRAPTVNMVLRNPANKDTVHARLSNVVATDSRPVPIALRGLTATTEPAIACGCHRLETVVPREPISPGKLPAAIGYPAPESRPIAIANTDGDASTELVTSNDAMATLVSGIVTTRPGVPLRSATTCGRGCRRCSLRRCVPRQAARLGHASDRCG
jgi:hypothetical protein